MHLNSFPHCQHGLRKLIVKERNKRILKLPFFPGDSQAGSWENIRMKPKCMAWLGQLFLSLYGSTTWLYLLQHSGESWGLSFPVLC